METGSIYEGFLSCHSNNTQPMTLFERYQHGETTEVYNEIYAMGDDAFAPEIFPQIDLILIETFKRVAFNLDIIYKELKRINYHFVSNIQYDWQRPLIPPHANTTELLSQLKTRVQNAGHIPLSLEYFYKYLGGCNFCWDWETNPTIPWEGADPLDIPPIENLFEMLNDEHLDSEILISGDDLQKDNISGSAYYIELTAEPSIDSIFTGYNMPFIEYLRLTMDNCGFTLADQCDHESLDAFCDYVRPKLLKI